VTERSFIEIDDVAHLDEAIRGSREKRTCFEIHSILITEGDSRMRDLKKNAVGCIGQAA